MDFVAEINALRKEKNAVILAHYYQIPEIQDIADYIGDSLALARRAAETDADIILFAGVHFMAETAKILNPDKKVLLPDMEAGCSLADSCDADELAKMKSELPGYKVLSYVNCSAKVKALSDVICTSGNALKIVESFPKDEKILFVPDRNLGAYINRETGRSMKLWQGSCQIHDILDAERIVKMKVSNPNAKLIAHPECNPAVLGIADFVGSTAAMLNFIVKDSSREYIVATETGIVHQMQKLCPSKKFYVAGNSETCACNDCPHMKRNTMEKLYLCLKNETPEISLDKDLIEKAKVPIQTMLRLS
ncbi:MAG: quinolinate synthase NadA [Bacteroidales bacterium]|nr:quinolinate synthase NadA [Bacteroidales bacterium]MDE7073148.1 quinolinate synthase NadA [Bacteroidales bacterium]